MEIKNIVFAPGALDDFEGTQEELDAVVKEIVALLESVEDIEELDAEEISEEMMEEIWSKRNLRH